MENSHASTDDAPAEYANAKEYITGWRFYTISLAFSLALLLIGIEITIVATSLVSISDDLKGFDRSSWIVSAYIVTYTGLLVISARLSDIFGRKICVIIFLFLFTTFSGACGAAQTMTQLIILRAMQGIGAAGSNAGTMAILIELVPPSKYAATTAFYSMVYALSFALGPVLGGFINERSTWRWIFLSNVPFGVLVILTVFFTLPARFPNHSLKSPSSRPTTERESFSKEVLARIDFTGAILLLIASVLLLVALEEANLRYTWQSPFIITTTTISGLTWAGFFVWSWKISRSETKRQPVFPWSFVKHKLPRTLFILALVSGCPMTVSVINIPLRLQSVNGLSPLDAGIRLLPFAVLMPIGTAVGSGLARRGMVSPVYLTIFGSVTQVIGLSVIGFAPVTTNLWPWFYVMEAFIGFGIGFVYAAATVTIKFVVEEKETPIANSAIVQFRLLGGVLGLAIVTTVFHTYVRSHLAHILSPEAATNVLQSTSTFSGLSAGEQRTVRLVLAGAYNLQFRIVLGFAAVQTPLAITLWGARKTINIA